MALPKIDLPIYETKLFSTGKTVRYRPFTVKEEKLFLMAKEGEDMDAIIDSIKQVLNNCILDEIDIETLPLFDVEYLFLRLRSVSVGESVKLQYKCNNILPKLDGEDEKKCNNVVEVDLNLNEVELDSEIKETKIEITENLGIVMKYPNFKAIRKLNVSEDGTDTVMDIAISCIDFIYDKDNVYYAKDQTKEELIEFVDGLQAKDLEKLKEFFDSTPKLKKQLEFKCTKCGYEEKVEVEGLQNFFA